MVETFRERLAVSKQTAQKLDGERFNLRKLNKMEFRKHDKIEISNNFSPSVNLSDGDDINRAWKNIKEDIKTSSKESLGLHEFKQHKLRFDEECLRF